MDVSGLNLTRKEVLDPFRRIYNNKEYKNASDHDKEFPFIVDVEPTNYCFFNCVFCNRQLMKRKKGFMSFETFKKIADGVASHRYSSIRFSGWGEPTMNKEIVRFVEYANKKGILTHLTTNGLNLEEVLIRKLLAAGVDKIKISFQGATKYEYEKMRNNKNYDEIVEKIKNLVAIRNEIDSKTFVQVSTSVTDETPEEINGFIEKWTKIVDGVFGVGEESSYLTSFVRVKDLDRVKTLNIEKSRVRTAGTNCMEILTKLSVSWSGNIKVCCSDFDDFLILGNIHNMSLEEAWGSKKRASLKANIYSGDPKLLPKFCRECDTLF